MSDGSLDDTIDILTDKKEEGTEDLPSSIKGAIGNDILTQSGTTFSKSFLKSKYGKNMYSDEIEGYLGDLENQGSIRVNGDKVYVEGYEAQTDSGHYCDECGKYYSNEEELSSHNMMDHITPVDSNYIEAEQREDQHLNQADNEIDQAIQAHQDEAVMDVDDKLDDVQDRATPTLDATQSATEKTLDILSRPEEVENPIVLDNEYHDDPNYLLGDRKVHVTTEYSLDRILDVLDQEDNGAFGSEADDKDESPRNKYVKQPGLESAPSCECLDSIADKLGGVENYAPEMEEENLDELKIKEPDEKYNAGELVIKPPAKPLRMGYTCESCGMFYEQADAVEFYAHKQIAHEEHDCDEKKKDEEQFDQMDQTTPTTPSMPTMENIGGSEDIWDHAKYDQKEVWSHEYLDRNPAFANELIDRNEWAYETAREPWEDQPHYVSEQLPEIMGVNKEFKEEEKEDKEIAAESFDKFIQQGKKEWAAERWAEEAQTYENPKKKL